MRKSFLLLLSLLLSVLSYGQDIHKYALTTANGHLYFNAEVFGEQAEIMVESGIPALLIGQDFYERSMSGSGISVNPPQAKIRLLNNEYQIAYKGAGRITVGDDIYDGPIFILKDFDGMSMPIQYLCGSNGNRTVSIDIKNSTLSIGGTIQNAKEQYKLTFDKKTGFPTVKSKVTIHSGDNEAVLKGYLIVDFGNPMLLFLMSQNKSVSKAIKSGKIVPMDAKNANGNVIAQGIYGNTVTVCGKEFNDVSLGLTGRMAAIEQMGFLGIPFFTTPVTFDFSTGKLYIQ